MASATDTRTAPALDTAASLFAGAGEMRARCRVFDWSATPLGPVEGWSQSLRTTVGIMFASRHPMFLWWGSGLVQLFNDGYLPSFGTTGRDVEALGANGREHWAEIWPVIGPQIERVLSLGEATWHEDQLVPITRNGRMEDVYWTYSYSPVRDDDGSVGGVLVVVQETTAHVRVLAETEALRAEAELARARMDELFRQAPAFIAVVRGPEFVFEVANDAYYQLIGYRAVIGRSLLDALPEVRGQGFIELLQGVLDSGVAHVGQATPLVLARTPGAEPEQRFVNFVYAPLIDADGSRSGVFVHGVDVTDQEYSRQEVVALNQQLAERTAEAEASRRAAEAANRGKSEFLATMSHELRTPLNAIGGYAELLEMGIQGPVTLDQRNALERIQLSQRHLLSLINGVLDYAKLEAGMVRYLVKPVPLHEVLAACEAIVMPLVRSRRLDFHSGGCAPHLLVRGDREKVQQILINLLSNAVKFTDPPGTVTLDCQERDDGFVAIRVVDTGRGLAADQLERVFQPFVQVDASLTRMAQGTGLGLAISRELARGMGGDITVTSTPGDGSTFTLTLPIQQELPLNSR